MGIYQVILILINYIGAGKFNEKKKTHIFDYDTGRLILHGEKATNVININKLEKEEEEEVKKYK